MVNMTPLDPLLSPKSHCNKYSLCKKSYSLQVLVCTAAEDTEWTFRSYALQICSLATIEQRGLHYKMQIRTSQGMEGQRQVCGSSSKSVLDSRKACLKGGRTHSNPEQARAVGLYSQTLVFALSSTQSEDCVYERG